MTARADAARLTMGEQFPWPSRLVRLIVTRRSVLRMDRGGNAYDGVQPALSGETPARAHPGSSLLVAWKAPVLRHGRTSKRTFGARQPKEVPLSPIATGIVRRINALFEIERSISGKGAGARLEVRRTLSRPLVGDLQLYMLEQFAKPSRGHDLAKAFNYTLASWN